MSPSGRIVRSSVHFALPLAVIFVPAYMLLGGPIKAPAEAASSESAPNRRMRLRGDRSWAKMAAGSDLLDDVFFNTEVDEKVVNDLVGSLESELTGERRVNAATDVQVTSNHAGNPAVGRNSNVQGSKMGLSQQELAKAGKI